MSKRFLSLLLSLLLITGAVWVPAGASTVQPPLTLKFECCEDSFHNHDNLKTTIVYNGDNFTNLPTPANRDGYGFDGWYTESSYENLVQDGIPIMSTTNFTLYAKWTAKSYRLTYETNQAATGITPPSPDMVTYDQKYSLPTLPARPGFTFLGWFDTSGKQIKTGDTIKITAATTLSAKWEAIEYTVTFNAGNYTGAPTIPQGHFTVDSKTITPFPAATPAREGYDFQSWQDSDKKDYTATTPVDKTSNFTLTAQREAQKHKVNFEYKFPSGSYSGTGQAEPSNPPEQEYTYDQPYGNLAATPNPMPSYEVDSASKNYTFEGWYEAALDEEKDPNDPDKDIKVYTKITPQTTFKGTDDTTKLYARWGYEVAFDVGEAEDAIKTSPAARKYTTGTAYGALPTFAADAYPGHSLEGWYTISTPGADGAVTLSGKVTGDSIADPQYKTLYAQWEAAEIEVTLDANGGAFGTGDDAKEKITGKVTFGSDYTALLTDANKPTRTGYSFEGWYKSQSFKDNEKVESGTAADDTATLYAKWEPLKIKLSFDFNYPQDVKDKIGSGTPPLEKPHTEIAPIEVSYGKQYNDTKDPGFPLSTPEPIHTPFPDYTFNGWYKTTEDSGDEPEKPIEQNSIVDFEASAATLHARWNYKVEFFANTGAAASNTTAYTSITATTGVAYGELPAKPDYKAKYFDGWYTEPDDTGDRVLPATLANPDVKKIYAHWTNTYNCTITLDGNGFTLPNEYKTFSYKVPFDSKYTALFEALGKLTPLTREGYAFDGWYTEKTGGVKVTADTVAKDDATLYAHWTINGYTVTLDPDYLKQTKTVEYNSAIGKALPATDPTRSGYLFEGWFTDAACTPANKITSSTATPVRANTTIYAKWTKSEAVALNLQGGTLKAGDPSSIQVAVGGVYPGLPIPTRNGYTFAGWFTQNEGGDQVHTGDQVLLDSTGKPFATLFAQWNTRKVVVKYDYGEAPAYDRVQSHTYDFGAYHSRLPGGTNTSWVGHEFLGWFTAPTGGEQITNRSPVTPSNFTDEALSVTIYARWGFKISFNPGTGGFGDMKDDVALLGQPYTPPACAFTPPEGMHFDHWYVGTDKKDILKPGESRVFTRLAELTAVWSDTPLSITSSSTTGGSIATAAGQTGTFTVEPGQNVTFVIRANPGYQLKELQVDGESSPGPFDDYTFRNVLEDHTIRAVFERTGLPGYATCPRNHTCPLSRFHDLNPKAWYHDAVHFCMENVIMNGASQSAGIYRPTSNITRAELTTALWNAAGRPDPIAGGSLVKNYSDVSASDYFYRQVVWATRNGIVNGYANGTFRPNIPITREQLAAILWRHAGRPSARHTTLDTFYDSQEVSSYAVNAMAWATENHIINGRSSHIIAPQGYATRAEVAQMLKNYLG